MRQVDDQGMTCWGEGVDTSFVRHSIEAGVHGALDVVGDWVQNRCKESASERRSLGDEKVVA